MRGWPEARYSEPQSIRVPSPRRSRMGWACDPILTAFRAPSSSRPQTTAWSGVWTARWPVAPRKTDASCGLPSRDSTFQATYVTGLESMSRLYGTARPRNVSSTAAASFWNR